MSLTADQPVGRRREARRHAIGASANESDEAPLPTAPDESNEELAWLAGHHSSESVQKKAFDELFRRLWRGSVEWARSAGATTQDQAEDVATQAWVRAWRYRHRYDRNQARYGTWLGTIVRNETLDVLRRESRHRFVSPEEAPEPDPSDPSTEDDTNMFALSYVWDAYDALREAKPEFANVLSLKAQGYQDKQICLELGIPKVGTVGSRLFRAKKFMAEWLARQGVVFLPEGTIGRVHPWGLNPLCRTAVGTFYGFSPLDGLFVLPTGSEPPPGARPVCDGFFVRVWSYPLRRFQVVSSAQDLGEQAQVVFKWNQYLVVKLQDGTAQATA